MGVFIFHVILLASITRENNVEMIFHHQYFPSRKENNEKGKSIDDDQSIFHSISLINFRTEIVLEGLFFSYHCDWGRMWKENKVIIGMGWCYNHRFYHRNSREYSKETWIYCPPPQIWTPLNFHFLIPTKKLELIGSNIFLPFYSFSSAFNQ